MTENNRVQSQTAPQSTYRHEWGDFLLHRWPTGLGLASAFITAFDSE